MGILVTEQGARRWHARVRDGGRQLQGSSGNESFCADCRRVMFVPHRRGWRRRLWYSGRAVVRRRDDSVCTWCHRNANANGLRLLDWQKHGRGLTKHAACFICNQSTDLELPTQFGYLPDEYLGGALQLTA